MNAAPKTFETHEKLSAKEFIEHFDTYANFPVQCLFRGVPRAEYDLVPSALRADIDHPPFGAGLRSTEQQVNAELDVLKEFFSAVYYQGLAIPKWEGVIEEINAVIKAMPMYKGWPPPVLHEFMALAQHHRIPTRLLDWTLDPLVAAYFAANDPGKTTTTAAVWVLIGGGYPPNPKLEAATRPIFIPYDINRNAHAQRGVFTLHLISGSAILPPVRQSLDQYLIEQGGRPDNLHKVTLPKTELPALLRLLNYRRINAASMYPGYDGAARAVKERRIWAGPNP